MASGLFAASVAAKLNPQRLSRTLKRPYVLLYVIAIAGVANAYSDGCNMSDSACHPAACSLARDSWACPAASAAVNNPLDFREAQRFAALGAGTNEIPGAPVASLASAAHG